MQKGEKAGTGKLGENAAASFLCSKGYLVTDRNFRTRFGEIDIIVTDSDYIVFTEVKTRKKSSMLLPREAVDIKKQTRIIKTAEMYIATHDIGLLQPRFDVIEVTTGRNSAIESINQIENAFTL